MTEFIGSRISLISKRDIRYVGTLHEISSENSTVALENVTSYGTEGRRPEEEIPPNLDNVYEYIVFRGSDVKDLRIEEAPKEAKRPEPPKVPDDPAILGSTRKPKSAVGQPPQSTSTPDSQFQIPPPVQSRNSQQEQNQNQHQGQSQGQGQNQGPFHNHNRNGPPPFQGHPFPLQPFQYGMPSPGHRFEPGPFPPGAPGPGFPGGPFGAPPGWYPPYGGPPHMHGQFHPHHMPVGPPGASDGPQGLPPVSPPALEAVTDNKTPAPKTPSKESTPAPTAVAQAPPPPVETKPDDSTTKPTTSEAKPEPPAIKHNRLIPAVPLSPAVKNATVLNGTGKQVIADTAGKPGPAKSIEDANRDARAAVAAAMAKLPAADKRSTENGAANIDSVTKAVGELRTSETRGRGRGYRGNRGDSRRVDVPKVDFDFESSNAKFNKQDLVKEAIANGSPVGTPAGTPDGIEGHEKRGSEAGISIPTGTSYNKSSSFFDDISSEIKDRAESKDGNQRLGGKEFRNEERQKNLETFGQGSVDNFKYGRGRGRGRGYNRGRGRGSYNQNGRGGTGGSRGNRESTAAADS